MAVILKLQFQMTRGGDGVERWVVRVGRGLGHRGRHHGREARAWAGAVGSTILRSSWAAFPIPIRAVTARLSSSAFRSAPLLAACRSTALRRGAASWWTRTTRATRDTRVTRRRPPTSRPRTSMSRSPMSSTLMQAPRVPASAMPRLAVSSSTATPSVRSARSVGKLPRPPAGISYSPRRRAARRLVLVNQAGGARLLGAPTAATALALAHARAGRAERMHPLVGAVPFRDTGGECLRFPTSPIGRAGRRHTEPLGR